ncbi:MAG TPA: DUF1559 domain-containing protein [Tepidisphaeraceae bacterium]|jgi:prepilin-type processing-associated H-X9-DG protein
MQVVTAPCRTRRAQRASAFTLVELLVVIGIIALLISILLPSLNKARRAARVITCSANLRSIGQAMQIYASQWKGYIPGGPTTTSAFMFTPGFTTLKTTYNNDNLPDVLEIFDWMSPIADTMGIKFNKGATANDRYAGADSRLETLRYVKSFRCPENDVIAAPSSFAPFAVIGPSMSYIQGIYFHLLPYDPSITGPGSGNYATASGSSPRVRAYQKCNVPTGYSPQLAKIKNSSKKIYMGDGARYSNPTTPPNMTPTYNSGSGGMQGDHGAFSNRSNGWNRSLAPGNTPQPAGGIDARIFSFRHGVKAPGQLAGQYKMNAVYFDGHVELIDDLTAANPALWIPTGGFYDPASTDVPLATDAKTHHNWPTARTVE